MQRIKATPRGPLGRHRTSRALTDRMPLAVCVRARRADPTSYSFDSSKSPPQEHPTARPHTHTAQPPPSSLLSSTLTPNSRYAWEDETNNYYGVLALNFGTTGWYNGIVIMCVFLLLEIYLCKAFVCKCGSKKEKNK